MTLSMLDSNAVQLGFMPFAAMLSLIVAWHGLRIIAWVARTALGGGA